VGNAKIEARYAQSTRTGQTPDEKKWEDIARRTLPPQLRRVVDTTEKAVYGAFEIMSSTGYPFNFYLKLEFRCCVVDEDNPPHVKWSNSMTLTRMVSDPEWHGEFNTKILQNFPDDLRKAVNTTWGELEQAAARQCKGG
jgi:hypothetical protein